MYCIARRYVLLSPVQEQRDRLLADLLDAVPDPYRAHGLRYDLPFLLTCLHAALLCNCDGTEAVAQWCRDHVDLLRDVSGPRLFLSPPGSLYRWLLPQLAASVLEQALGTWTQAITRAAADEQLALDGKTARGARVGEQGDPHLLSFVTHQSQETFLQMRVGEKTNRIPVAKEALPTLPISKRVCTAAEFLRLLHGLGADGLLRVKGNQPILHADPATYFADPGARYQQTEIIKVSTEMTTYLATTWPHLGQVAQLTRRVHQSRRHDHQGRLSSPP